MSRRASAASVRPPPRAGSCVGVRSPGHGAAGCDRIGTVVEVAGELVRVRWIDGQVTAIATTAIELLDVAPRVAAEPEARRARR